MHNLQGWSAVLYSGAEGRRRSHRVWPQLPWELFLPPRVLTAPMLCNSGRGTMRPRVKHESRYRLSSVNTVKESITNSNRPEVELEWVNVSICFPGFGSRIAKKGMFIFFSFPRYTRAICHLQCIAYWFFFPPAPSISQALIRQHMSHKKKRIRMLMARSLDPGRLARARRLCCCVLGAPPHFH